MKVYKIIGALILLGCMVDVHAQLTPPHSCATARNICGTIDDTFIFTDPDQCTQALFYSINYTQPSTFPTLHIEAPLNQGANILIFGPFTGNILDACSQVESFSVQPEQGYTANGVHDEFTLETGFYIIMIVFNGCVDLGGEHDGVRIRISPIGDILPNCKQTLPLPCTDCIPSFSPNSGEYVVSAWVKEEGVPASTTTYTNAAIEVSFTGSTMVETLIPSGQIIDGWQRIEGVIEVPATATDIHISLETSSGDVYFDDIRFHPLDGSMRSYVYDPRTLRLMAELDERNYATFYEYDEEGKVTRMKKETERGVMTIQENRNNIQKQ